MFRLLEISTVRALERRSERVFACGVAGFLAGAALSLFGWDIIGLPLLLISAITLLVEMGWITWTLHEPCKQEQCPHCSATNEVFATRRTYRCDSCGKESVAHKGGWPDGSGRLSPTQ